MIFVQEMETADGFMNDFKCVSGFFLLRWGCEKVGVLGRDATLSNFPNTLPKTNSSP